MEKILEYIICDKYTNKELENHHNLEYYLIKFSQKELIIFSDKTYRFEYFTKQNQNLKLDFLIEMIDYRLENLSDCKTTMNKFDKSILVEYNENNTLLMIKIVNDVINDYFNCIGIKNYYGINLHQMLKSNYLDDNSNIIINNDFKINIDELKENLFKCYDVKGIGKICGKIIFDNVFNYSRSLKNKIDIYNLEEYMKNLPSQESLKTIYEKNFSIAKRFKK